VIYKYVSLSSLVVACMWGAQL